MRYLYTHYSKCHFCKIAPPINTYFTSFVGVVICGYSSGSSMFIHTAAEKIPCLYIQLQKNAGSDRQQKVQHLDVQRAACCVSTRVSNA